MCATAMNIENNFRDRLLAGETVEQIRTDYLDTYGTTILCSYGL